MASKWALAKANEIEKKHGHCCGDVIELYTDSLAQALDASAEEVANIAADESPFWSAESKKEFAKRVLDKRRR